MQDALGSELVVGDWVVQWSSKSLTFGKIEKISEHLIATRRFEPRIKGFSAKIRGMNGILSPFKTSDQILLLSPEKALLLALEK
jgi:hypothetical protein